MDHIASELRTNQTGFSEAWDRRYAENTHLSIWPWSDMVSYVCRYAKPRESFAKVLELGCGAGANIPFFLNRSEDYYAIEGSPTIIAALLARFPELSSKIACNDFTQDIPFDVVFDMVVDRASLTHNDTASIDRSLALVASKIRTGGLYIGIDWFSTEHPDAKKGTPVDAHTRRNIESRTFGDVGNVHFSDKHHLCGLFERANFKIIMLEHKKTTILIGDRQTEQCAFNFVAIRC